MEAGEPLKQRHRLPPRRRLDEQVEAMAGFVGGFAPSSKEPDDGTGGFLQGPAISETAGPTPMEADDF